jgi:hypothetical protein
MARRYTTSGRVGALVARGAKLKEDQADAVLSGDIELTLDQVSQITLKFSDPSMKLLGSRIFDPPKEPGKAGSSLDYAGLKFEVAVVETGETSGTVTLGVTARSLGVQKLRRPFSSANAPKVTPVLPRPGDPGFIGPVAGGPRPGDPNFIGPVTEADRLRPPAPSGPGQARGVSPTEYLRLQAKQVGLKFVGEESAMYPLIGPVMNEETKQLETLWDVAVRLAREVGFIVFEAAGTLYFGRPTWLVARTDRLKVEWAGAKTSGSVLGVPTCRRTGDDPQTNATATVDVTLAPSLGEKARPGMALDLSGVPTFNGRYIITRVSIPLADDAAIGVSAAVPENPEPDPPEGLVAAGGQPWGGLVGDNGAPILPSGKYGGITLTTEQTTNAGIIHYVGRQVGASQNDRVLALMCAAQESSLKNLTGGDRDSAGLFQQRPSQGWGTWAQIIDPMYSSRKFYSVLMKKGTSADRMKRERWEVIQSVQRSGLPRAYAKWEPMAVDLARRLDDASSAPPGGAGGTAKGTAEAFVQYALAQAGDPYVFGAEARLDDNDPDAFDCSELCEWAAFRAGAKFVDGSKRQLEECRRKGTTISVAQGLKLRGALLFRMTGDPTHVAISLGDGSRTIEAMGRKYGVLITNGGNRGWTHAGKVPGLLYGAPYTPPLTGGMGHYRPD